MASALYCANPKCSVISFHETYNYSRETNTPEIESDCPSCESQGIKITQDGNNNIVHVVTTINSTKDGYHARA